MVNGMHWDEKNLKLMRHMFCSICEHNTCDSCFVPDFTRFVSKMNEFEVCVLCTQQTPYRLREPVESRQFYVEGSGQLCEQCYKQMNDTH